MRQGHDFFTPLGPPGSHEAKRTFRLVPPILVRFLHLQPWTYFALQVALGVLTLALIARLVEGAGFSRREALAFAVALSSTIIGATWFADTRPLFDALALSALVFALATPNAVLVFVAVSAAVWTDERALIAAVSILVWHWLRERNRAAIATAAAVAMYGVVRYWLTVHYAIVVDRQWVGLSVLNPSIRYAPLALAISLEALWALLIVGLVAMVRSRRFQAIAIAAAALLASFVAVLVYDVSRSAAYLLPALIVVTAEGLRNSRLRRELLVGCAVACTLMPTAIVTGYPAMPSLLPLPAQVWQWTSGKSGLK